MSRTKIFSTKNSVVSTVVTVVGFSAFLMVGGCGGDDGGNNPSGHTHSYGVWDTATPATCQSSGQRERACNCGHTETQTIPKLTGATCEPTHAHSYGAWETVTPPTCQLVGQRRRACSCGDIQTEPLPRLSDAQCGSSGGDHFNPNITYGSITDSRDGKKYRTVVIGTQTWMAENLNYNAAGSVCYDNSADSCAKYGRLYNWHTVMNGSSSSSSSPSGVQGICPAGWHVPSVAEWETLVKFVDPGVADSKSVDPGVADSWGWDNVAGTKLKAKSGWYDNFGTDVYGFSALGGGERARIGDPFREAGTSGFWWSATMWGRNSNGAWHLNIVYYPEFEYAFIRTYSQTMEISLRCVRD